MPFRIMVVGEPLDVEFADGPSAKLENVFSVVGHDSQSFCSDCSHNIKHERSKTMQERAYKFTDFT